MTLTKKPFYVLILICLVSFCNSFSQSNTKMTHNPFMVAMNVPVDYAKVTSADVEQYAKQTVTEVTLMLSSIKKQKTASFSSVFGAMDYVKNKIYTANNNCFMLYWVSTDSIIRAKGLAGNQLLDSLSTSIYSDKGIYTKMIGFKKSADYKPLKENKKRLVDEMIENFERSGVNLNAEQLTKFKSLTKEISELSASFSLNMNSSRDILKLDEKGTQGLPEAFKLNYKVADGKYEIPIINATSETVLSNATSEETRKAYYIKFYNRAADKNIVILDSMVKKRDELAKVMGYPTYAAYALVPKMANNPTNVWNFLNDLVNRSKTKAKNRSEHKKRMLVYVDYCN